MVHGRDGERIGTDRCALQDLHTRKRGDLKHDADELHLVVEFAGDDSRDFNLVVEQLSKADGVGIQDRCVNQSAVYLQAKRNAV